MRALVARLARRDRARTVVNRCADRLSRLGWLGGALARRAARRVPRRPFRAVFVCKGNICRSAFAEHAARELVRGAAGWEFSSAGLEARPGNEPPAEARRVAREFGVDLDRHRARAIETIDPARVDLVLAMEPAQLADPRLQAFRARGVPVVLLGGPAGYPVIADPYGRDEPAFRACFERVVTALERLLHEPRRAGGDH